MAQAQWADMINNDSMCYSINMDIKIIETFEIFNIEVSSLASVAELKCHIGSKFRRDMAFQNLIYGTSKMDDSWMVGNYINTQTAQIYILDKAPNKRQ